jgi:hypothetical protein
MFQKIICEPYDETAKMYRYIIVDSEWRSPSLPAVDLLDAVVIAYKNKNQNVGANIVRFLIWFTKDYSPRIQCLTNKYYSDWIEARAPEFKNDIERLLLLV